MSSGIWQRSTPPEVWFWSKVDRGVGCWIWQASKHVFGYGQCKFRGTIERAHRIAWILTYGEIPKGLCVMHACDILACVNPSHLRLGTIADNNRDMLRKGRASGGSLKGEQNPKAKIADEDVVHIRELAKSGLTYRTIGQMYGLQREAIGQIVRRERWVHVLT